MDQDPFDRELMGRSPDAFFTIGRKLGLLFVGLSAVLAAFSAVVVVELGAIREDAEQLLEETREAGQSARLRVELEGVSSLLGVWAAGDAAVPAAAAAARAHLEAVEGMLARLERGPGDRADPSRGEHQRAEGRLTARIRGEIAAVTQRLATGGARAEPGGLEHSLDDAGVLAAETQEEAARANGDLLRRADRASRVMLATVGAAVLVLCGLLWLVRRMVVGPLRVLRDRAEQVGAGRTPIPQVPLRSRDEIGALARSFEEMARRVASNEQELRERVEARTRELVRAARYADIGVLAAGVAHEINNPLASIASCAEGLERRLRKREVALAEQCEDLQTIASEAYRARSITARLLALARPERSPDGRVELDRVAREVEAMTRYQFEERAVRLTLDLPSTGTAVVGDHGDLLQMTVNLVLNARDASPRGAEVQLRVRAAAGAEVELIVDDAGDGVPAADVDRIFDPFFTTKEVGQGTGLGLALVAAVVEAHRGRIRVGRSPSGGARFEVALRGWSGVPG